MANPWFRMYGEFANDPKVQMMSEAMQRRLVMILCLRCSNGDVTLHDVTPDVAVSFQLRISMDEVAETKALFMARGFIDEDWNIVNWEKRQYVSDSSAERVRRFRDSRKKAAQLSNGCNVTVTPPDTDTDTDIDIGKTDSSATPQTKQTKSRGSRLPEDWSPSEEQISWAKSERPGMDLRIEADRFRDYWISTPGAKGVKLDWSATWRNWIRNSNPQNRPQPQKSPTAPARRMLSENFKDLKPNEL